MSIIIDNQPELVYGTYEPPVTYEIKKEVSDYELLTRFNPYYISEKISGAEEDIEAMYDRTYPHLASDEYLHQIYYESFPLEKLAIEIMEQKQKLDKFVRKSQRDLKAFYKVIGKYKINEQNDIKRYMKSNATYTPDIIDRLKSELYELVIDDRTKRNELRETKRRERNKEHAKQIRNKGVQS
ncbi:hypothetical protein RAL98_04250 [Staphylococcus sp. HKU1]|uniref:hypothetical protein n=1 Tax=Staphylococcus sp. HKU1 TaxID=3068989 RepID=UPI003AAAF230